MGKRVKHLGDIGIILCDCGGTLSERLEFSGLEESLKHQSGVTSVVRCSRFCRKAETFRMIQKLAEKGCRRLVIGACLPSPAEAGYAKAGRQDVHDEVLGAAMSAGGIRPGMATAVNLREHCAWVHSDRRQATAKAVDLMNAAIRRAAYLTPVTFKQRRVNPHVIVLGGGIAGLHTASRLSALGHSVTLVNREDELGGCAAKFSDFFSYLDHDPAEAANQLRQSLASAIERVKTDRWIRLMANASLQSVDGEAGQFSVVIQVNGREQTLKAGALVLAVGSLTAFPFPSTPGGSASGGKGSPSSCVMDLASLAGAIRSGQSLPRKIAILMDMDGEQGRAVNALALSAVELLAVSRRRQVTLYCRHIRVAAWGMEALYRRARNVGTVIVRYEMAPTITEQAKAVMIQVKDTQSGKVISENYDLAIMADPWSPTAPPEAGKLRLSGNGKGVNLPRAIRCGPDGALQADNVWLLSSKTNQPGIYVVGAARGNSELREALNDAGAAAEAIHQFLGAKQITVCKDAAMVDAEKCVLCLTCIRSCPHGAMAVDAEKESASVSEVTCQRCGLCATLCPARAIQLPRFSDDQVMSELNKGAWVTVFACENSAWPAATVAGVNRWEYGADVRLIRVPCAGRVDDRYVLGALERGAARVMILGCYRENCRYLVGADHASKRIERLRAMLAKAGIEPSRLVVGGMTEFEANRFLDYVKG